MKKQLDDLRESFPTTIVGSDRGDDLFRARVVKAVREAQSRRELL